MASILYVQYDKTPTGKAIKHEADAEQVAKRLYRPITRHLGDRLATIEADDQATTLLLDTSVEGVQVQLLHKSQVEAMSEGETSEWQIIHGNFDTDEVTEEYLGAETEPATVAERLLAVIDTIDNPPAPKSTASKRKLPVKPRKSAEADEVVKAARAITPDPKEAPRRKLPRKSTPPAQPEVKATPKRVGKLPVKKGSSK